VDFLMIVLITTEFVIYSIISTMICAFDFSSSEPICFFILIYHNDAFFYFQRRKRSFLHLTL
jgi:hypothetical protein